MTNEAREQAIAQAVPAADSSCNQLTRLISGELKGEELAAGLTAEQRKQCIFELARAHAAVDMGGLQRLSDLIVSWRQVKQFETTWDNVPEKLMLIVTALSEAMEAYRHLNAAMLAELKESAIAPAPADERQLLYYENFVEELADVAIRLLDLCGSLGIKLGMAVALKMGANWLRPTKHNKQR